MFRRKRGEGEAPAVPAVAEDGRSPDGDGPAPRPGEAGPASPARLSRRAWWATLRRTVRESRADNITDWAGALTYYGVLAIFPALIALVSILGLIGESATQPLLDNLTDLTPGTANDVITNAIDEITASQGAAGLALVLGIVAALWSASGYVGAFSRASNAIYEVSEHRPFWKLRPLQVAVTAILILLLVVMALAVVVTGPVSRQVGDLVGVGGTAVTIWDIAKWPAIAAGVVLLFAVLYYAAPNVKQPGFRWITPGSVLALVVWLAASAGFAIYIANFGSYNATYGSLAGVAIFLVWLWISNLALLLGAELNSEIERTREIASGVPEEQTLAMERRQAPRGSVEDRARRGERQPA